MPATNPVLLVLVTHSDHAVALLTVKCRPLENTATTSMVNVPAKNMYETSHYVSRCLNNHQADSKFAIGGNTTSPICSQPSSPRYRLHFLLNY